MTKIDYEITVDVSGADVETKKRVQDAFFKLGFKWRSEGCRKLDGYNFLGWDGYTNTDINGVIPGRLMYIIGRTIKPTHTIDELLELAGMENKTKLFNLEMALAGEPVVTRDGRKAYIRHHETLFNITFPLVGYVISESNNYYLSSWTITGEFRGSEMESLRDIVGMWKEPLAFEHWDLLCEDIKYLAKDNEENWWGYVCKPIQNKTHREWVIGGMHDGELTLDAFELEGLNPKLFPECNWEDSLTKRPEK